MANLQGLSSLCKFGALQDKMIRDQLIERTNKDKVQETLTRSRCFSRCLEHYIALQVESAAECTATLTKQQVATPLRLFLSSLEVAPQPKQRAGSQLLDFHATATAAMFLAMPTTALH